MFYKSINGELSTTNRLKKFLMRLAVSSASIAPTMAMEKETPELINNIPTSVVETPTALEEQTLLPTEPKTEQVSDLTPLEEITESEPLASKKVTDLIEKYQAWGENPHPGELFYNEEQSIEKFLNSSPFTQLMNLSAKQQEQFIKGLIWYQSKQKAKEMTQELHNEVEGLNKKVWTLNSEVSKVEELKKQLKTRQETEQAASNMYSREKESMQKHHENELKQQQKTIEQLTVSRDQATKSLEEEEAAHIALNNAHLSLQEQYEAVTKALEEKNTENEKLNNSYADLEKKLKKAQKASQSLIIPSLNLINKNAHLFFPRYGITLPPPFFNLIKILAQPVQFLYAILNLQ